MTKNVFFILSKKHFLFWRYWNFWSDFFGQVEKRLDKKAKVTFNINGAPTKETDY